MAIGKYSHNKLISIIKQTHDKLPADAPVAGNPAGSNRQLQFNDAGSFGAVTTVTFDGNELTIPDDKKFHFGNNQDAHIEYDEDGTDLLVISGSSAGVKLRGTKVEIDGTLEGASPLKIGGAIKFVSSEGAASAFNFGPNDEARIYYQNSPTSALVLSGSTEIGGLTISGSSVNIDCFVGIGVGEGNVTHALTLPNSSNADGQVKASSFVTYSSIRYKKDVEPLTSAVDTISKLQGVSYNWKDTGKKDYGFIAEEVGKIIPDIVEWSQDPQYANTIDYSRIISFLVEAVKEQQKKINFLYEKIDKFDI